MTLALRSEPSSTLIDHLRLRAAQQGNEILYRFLASSDVEGPVEEWSYSQLDFRARALGALLQELDARGERALLLYPPGLEFIAAFMGCLYGGVVAVPSYPPDPGRFERTLSRLRAIIADCGARYVLTTTAIAQTASALLPQAPELASLQWVASDMPDPALASAYRQPDIRGDALAFLQYTSGSTGSPRGVMVSHANLAHNGRLIARGFAADAETVVVSWLPLFHDMGLIGNVLQPLYSGCSCILMSPLSFLQRPLLWLQAISKFRAAVSGGPNFAYDLCVRKVSAEERATLDLRSWKIAFNGAEPVRAHTLTRFADTFASCGFAAPAFYPCYGLAEATLFVSGADREAPAVVRTVCKEALGRDRVVIDPESPSALRLVSSGRPMLDTVIVDAATRTRCPPDRVGEIWLRGQSVSRGYWNRPEDTAQTFGARLADTDEGPFLRTGDLGFVHDGELFVTGRCKDVVILRGQNHYPQDIERTAEQAHPSIRAGCCAAFSMDDSSKEWLVVVAEMDGARAPEGAMAVAEAIRHAIAEDHGVHAGAVVLVAPRSIPKTSSGKIQRHACRLAYLDGSLVEVARSIAETPAPRAARTGELETALRAALPEERRELMSALVRQHVAEMIGSAPARIADDRTFMSLGLDSLALVEVQERIEASLDMRLPSAFLWQHPTLDAASEALLACRQQAQDRTRSPLVQGPKKALMPDTQRELPPVSAGQFRLWFLSQLDPSSPAYHVVFGLRMRGQLDRRALALSLTDAIARHDVLRTVYREVNGHLRQVVKESGPLDMVIHDIHHHPEPERAMHQLGQDLAREPFELAHGPLIRAALVVLGDTEHVLFIAQHHIMTDGWSIGVLARELAELYQARATGTAARLPPPPLQYADYARWQRSLGSALDAQRGYWVRQLADLPRLELATDAPRPRRLTLAGGGASFHLSGALTESLEELARREGVTLFVTLMAIYAVLLHRYTGQEDFGVGTVTAHRDHPETRALMGLLANTVVLRCDASGAPTFIEMVRRIRNVVAGALAHADVPFDEVVEATCTTREASRNPLFQVSFVLESLNIADMELAGTRWSPVMSTPAASVEGTAKFDLELIMSKTDGGLWGVFEYNTALFHDATIERLRGHFCTLVAHVVDRPEQRISRLSLLADDEASAILAMSASGQFLPERRAECVHDRFAAQARTTPDAPAVIAAGAVLSYGDLDRRANQLAHALAALGVAPDVRVGIFMERSLEMIVAILGILKAGGAYVPLDPTWPRERVAYVVDDANIHVVITDAALGERLAAYHTAVTCVDVLAPSVLAQPESAPYAGTTPDDLAYVIYTSGSTGRPKGAMIEHRSVMHFSAALRQLVYQEQAPGLHVAMNASLSFDASVQQWVQLLDGHTLVLVPEEERRDPGKLLTFLHEHRIDVIDCTPTQLRLWLNSGFSDDFASLSRTVLVGGEAMDSALWHTVRKSARAVFYNVYGPTECTIDSTAKRIADASAPTIGRPFGAIRVYILDRDLMPVPIGVRGEIHIGGPGLARGYLGRRALTAERFIPDPFGAPGGRLYRTGDMGRYLPDGDIEFLGREDHQVKVRGFRIELDEIDARLDQHPEVQKAVTVVREHGTHQASLVAYLVVDGARPPSVSELRRFVGAWLPTYMIPEKFVIINQVPLTHSGKIDYRALPVPDDLRPAIEQDYVAPRNPIETRLAAILADVLGLERVGVHDDFFALGGHSLAAAQVVSRVRTALDIELSLRSFFEYPTVCRLAELVAGEIGASISGEYMIPSDDTDLEKGEL